MNEIRTPKGKLVGMVDMQTNSLHIKDGKKTTLILIPESGLNMFYISGTGITEEVYIPPSTEAHCAV